MCCLVSIFSMFSPQRQSCYVMFQGINCTIEDFTGNFSHIDHRFLLCQARDYPFSGVLLVIVVLVLLFVLLYIVIRRCGGEYTCSIRI